LPLIAECHAIQDADFSEELAVRAINLRWKCLGIMDTVGLCITSLVHVGFAPTCIPSAFTWCHSVERGKDYPTAVLRCASPKADF
jgi:hypothetical protein